MVSRPCSVAGALWESFHHPMPIATSVTLWPPSSTLSSLSGNFALPPFSLPFSIESPTEQYWAVEDIEPRRSPRPYDGLNRPLPALRQHHLPFASSPLSLFPSLSLFSSIVYPFIFVSVHTGLVRAVSTCIAGQPEQSLLSSIGSSNLGFPYLC